MKLSLCRGCLGISEDLVPEDPRDTIAGFGPPGCFIGTACEMCKGKSILVPMANCKGSKPREAAKVTTVVTWEELSLHTADDDLWVAVDGKAYDVSGFAAVHPG